MRAVIALIVVPTAAFCVAIYMDWSLRGQAFWRGLFLSVGMSLFFSVGLTALAFLVTAPSTLRRLRQRLDMIFANDPRVVPLAPRDATHRLVCAWVLPRRRFYGGSLYVCATRLRFQGHYPVAPWWRRAHEETLALDLGPLRSIVIECGTLSRTWWERWLAVPALMAMVLRSEDIELILRCAAVEEAARGLEACLDRLRHEGTMAPPV